MARIAIDARIINSSTGRYVERLVHYLEELDGQHEYLLLVRKKDKDFYTPTNPRFKVVVADYKDYSFGEQLGFAWFLYRLRVDFVHFCMPQQPILYLKKSVTTVHDLSLLYITENDDMGRIELRIKQQIFKGLLWWIAHKNKHIISPSNYTKTGLVDFARISPDKVSVTYEGADVVATDAETPYPELDGKKFIMYVGRAEPYKNNRGLIQAHQELLKKYPDLYPVIVGMIDILRHSDQQWVSELDYKQIIFTGYANDPQLAWLYRRTAAYVFPSLMEGFGLPGLEAMSYGAPVVSSNATCLPEVYGNAAEYFPPTEITAMAQAIDRVIGNSERRSELIDLGRAQASRYSWRNMARETYDIYKKVL